LSQILDSITLKSSEEVRHIGLEEAHSNTTANLQ